MFPLIALLKLYFIGLFYILLYFKVTGRISNVDIEEQKYENVGKENVAKYFGCPKNRRNKGKNRGISNERKWRACYS